MRIFVPESFKKKGNAPKLPDRWKLERFLRSQGFQPHHFSGKTHHRLHQMATRYGFHGKPMMPGHL